MRERVSKNDYYLRIADSVSERSTCLRRKYGAVIVRDDEIVSTGYNGAPRGRQNCSDCRSCDRDRENVAHNTDYSMCRSVHAEANAIISAARSEMIGATLYLFGRDAKNGERIEDTDCCPMCKRFIINAGIKIVVTHNREIQVRDWIYDDDSLRNVKGKGM